MPEQSKRIKKLKAEIIKEIPRFPNNKETKLALEAEALPGVLLAYLNWVGRHVRPATRKTIISPELTSSPHWRTHKDQIKSILKQSEEGQDLNSYLSLKAHKHGYTVPQSSEDRWNDKDFILHTKGLHHFHLSDTKMPAGHMDRTNELLFAYIDREQFHALGIYDHGVFETLPNGGLHPERVKLLQSHERIIQQRVHLESIFIDNPITMSGHTLNAVMLAQQYTALIDWLDSRLDDYEFVKEQFFQGNVPDKYKLSWYMHFTNLCVLEEISGQPYIIRDGLN